MVMIAHGSRKTDANEEFINLVQRLNQHNLSVYRTITHAFLEMAKPDITEAIGGLIETGVEDIDIFPYFLNCGNHITRDIPKLITDNQQQHQNVRITLLPYFGVDNGIEALLLTILQKQAKPSDIS